METDKLAYCCAGAGRDVFAGSSVTTKSKHPFVGFLCPAINPEVCGNLLIWTEADKCVEVDPVKTRDRCREFS